MGKHLPAIDGLRAVAVLAVIAYHAGAPAGYVGVDVFFVISGYVITRVLLADGNLPAFYARRARRILPAAFLVVLATLALSFLLLPSAGDVARSSAAAGVFVANIHFQSVTGGYWDQSAETMPLLHLWSLSVEEQFYLLWPLVLLFGRKWIGWLALASLALYAVLSYASPEAAFYQTPARAWELAAGGLVALGTVRAPRDLVRHFGLPTVLLACLVPMPVWAAQPLAVLGTTMLVASIHAGHRSVLAAKPLVWVGLISYSLYLWHWPLLAIDRAIRGGEAPLDVRLSLVAAAFVLSVLSYRYVEQPFRRMDVRAGRAIGVGLAAAIALSVGAWSFAPAPMAKVQHVAPLACQPHGLGIPVAISLPKCLTTERKVVLWGDSFAAPWQPLAMKLAAEEGLPLTLFFRYGCYPTAGVTIWRRNTVETRGCRKFNDETLAWIKANGADTVVIASFYAELFREHPAEGRQGLEALVAALKPARVVIVAPTPELRRSDCLTCAPTRAEFDAQAGAAKAELSRLGVEVVDASAFYCDDAMCKAAHSDQHHVTAASVQAFLDQTSHGE